MCRCTKLLRGRIIDGTGVEPIEKGLIIVDKGKIVDVGPEKDVAIPKNAELIDATGKKTIIPGLIDFHNHYIHNKSFGRFFKMKKEYGVAKTALLGMHNAENWIRAGITTVNDHGGDLPLVVAIRDEIDAGRISGPRTVFTHFINREAHGVEEIKRSVEEIIVQGVAQRIMLTVSGTYSSQTLHEITRTPEEVKAAIEVAHAHGKKIDGLSHNPLGVMMLCEYGADSIGHAVAANDDALEAIRKRNIPWCPVPYTLLQASKLALTIPESDVNESRLSPPIKRAWLKAMKDNMKAYKQSIKKAYDMGITLLPGSDIAPPQIEDVIVNPNNIVCDIDLIMQWTGMTPMQALMSATNTSAKALDLGDKIGTLEKEKIADLVICKGDPLKNLRKALDPQNIWLVMKEGNIMYLKD